MSLVTGSQLAARVAPRTRHNATRRHTPPVTRHHTRRRHRRDSRIQLYPIPSRHGDGRRRAVPQSRVTVRDERQRARERWVARARPPRPPVAAAGVAPQSDPRWPDLGRWQPPAAPSPLRRILLPYCGAPTRARHAPPTTRTHRPSHSVHQTTGKRGRTGAGEHCPPTAASTVGSHTHTRVRMVVCACTHALHARPRVASSLGERCGRQT